MEIFLVRFSLFFIWPLESLTLFQKGRTKLQHLIKDSILMIAALSTNFPFIRFPLYIMIHIHKNTQTNASSSAEKCADRNSSHSEYRHLLYKLSMVKCHQVFCSFKLFSCKFIATNHSFPVFNHYAFRVILLKFHICTRPLRSHTM